MQQLRDRINPILPSPDLTAHARDLLRHLDEGGPRFVLWDKVDGEQIELSEALFELLRAILIDLSQNRAIQILPVETELTTVQAAEFLRVSRPHVVKLISQGKLACRMVGTHRRLRLADLVAFRQAETERSQAAREAITRDAEKHGWGY